MAGRSHGVEILVAVDGDGDGPDERIVGAVTYVPGPDSPGAEFTDADAAGIRMLAVAIEARATRGGRGAHAGLHRAGPRPRAAGRSSSTRPTA